MKEKTERKTKTRIGPFAGGGPHITKWTYSGKIQERGGTKIKMIYEKEKSNPDKTEMRKVMNVRHTHCNELGKMDQFLEKQNLTRIDLRTVL